MPDGYYIVKSVPTFLGFLKKRNSFKELLWKIISGNHFWIYLVKNESDEIVHKSVKIGKCYKFNFLKKTEFEIGPCYTVEKYRGQGIYPIVLRYIVSEDKKVYFIFIHKDNHSSIKGVEKAGFSKVGYILRKKGGIWKRI